MVGLRDALGQGLCGQIMDGPTLVGVRKVLYVDDFGSSILLDERKDANTVVLVRGAFYSGERACQLGCDREPFAEITGQPRRKGRTWATTFPGASIASWIWY